MTVRKSRNSRRTDSRVKTRDGRSSASAVAGLHAVEALLNNPAADIRTLHVLSERSDERVSRILELARKRSLHVVTGSRAELNDLAESSGEGVDHQGVLAIVGEGSRSSMDPMEFLNTRPTPWLILVLDEVQDPHNLGACLRSADAAGVDAVIIPRANSVGLTPIVRKVASGAAETVPMFAVGNLVRTLETLKSHGVWVHGAAGEAVQSLYELTAEQSTAIVLGAEGRGLRRLTREACDSLFRIPMRGSVSSLNVSVATGIILFELRRTDS